MYRLILVDDEPSLLEGISCHYPWEALGFCVEAKLPGGRELFQYLEEHEADVILTDISMPGMDGIEIARRLFEENSSILVVFLSGYADFKYARQALRYQVYDYILKPIKEDELTTIFQKIKIRLDLSRGSQESEESYYNRLIARIRSYMDHHLSTANLKEAAAQAGLSSSYLSYIFKQYAGATFSDELLQKKMEHARLLLSQGDLRTYEIAERLGYEDPKNFTRAFRSYFGVSPRDFKKKGET